VKPLIWIASTRRDLQEFPEGARQDVGYALFQAQLGETNRLAKPLKGFGTASVVEVVADHHGNAFRAVYTVRFAEAVYVLHVFQKKSKRGAATPRHDIDLIRRRLRDATRLREGS
jgi:phage-related protein